ncbi:MAG: S8 family serine peptidase, partial [Planctomycetes bacterium]|nr:S8 family serine peptidase [Planctomycetota bacterium]
LALAATQAVAGDAVHYQGGIAHEVFTDDTHLMIVTDGQTTSVDLALSLAAEGLATSLVPVGDSLDTFDVAVGQVTQQLIDSLENQDGVIAAYRVVRFRQDGQAFGVTGDIVVKFNEGTSAAQRAAFELEYNLESRAAVTGQIGLRNVYVFKALGDDALARVSALWSDHRLADWNAHADLIAPLITSQAAPQDEFFNLQWHLENNGNFPGSIHADIEVFDAWEISRGASIRVGMFDTGCDITHDDLAANYLGVSQNNRGGGGEIFPSGGHGTAVMGLMVAEANSIGVVGVAPEAQFTASSFGGSLATIAGSYNFAITHGVDVHNNSWEFSFGLMPDVVVDAIRDAANTGRDGKGMVIAFAAGNEATELEPGDLLSTLPEVIQVGATGQTDVIASYSNFGITQDIMGPTLGDDGVGLATTDTMGSGGFNDGNSAFDILGAANYTRIMSGTSGASPVVAGVVALVLSENPNLNRVQVRSLLIHTTDRVSPLDADYGATTRFSLRYGFGRVNAAKAVEAATASLGGNATWPGRVQDISIRIIEGEDDIEATLSWLPSGMILGGEGDEIATDEEDVVIFYRVPGQEGPNGIQFTPEDGVLYEPCDPNDFENCILPAPFGSPNLVVIYSGPPNGEPTGGDTQRRVIENLVLAGNDPDDAQLFAMYALSSNGLYSFARVFDQEGEDVGGGGGDDGGIIVPPPDQGRPIDPELTPDEVGKNDPPSVTATANRTVCGAPCTIEFHGGVMTSNEIVDRGWSFGDGVSSSEDSATHTYELPGTYNAVFFAMDDEEPTGRISTKLIQIAVGLDADGGAAQPGFRTAAIQVLTASPIIGPNAQVRLSVQTTGVGESQSSVRITYDWDFGDGNIGTGQTAENIYANPGSFSVLVLVTEELADGQRIQLTASTIVEIEGVPSTSGQSFPLGQSQGAVDDSSSAGACGVLGAALLTLTLLGLCRMRFRRRRAC